MIKERTRATSHSNVLCSGGTFTRRTLRNQTLVKVKKERRRRREKDYRHGVGFLEYKSPIGQIKEKIFSRKALKAVPIFLFK